MKKLAVAGLLSLAVLPVFADPVFRNGDDTVTLRSAVCSDEIKAIAKERQLPEELDLLAADARVGGQMFKACWSFFNGRIVLIYEDGDVGQLPPGGFKEEPGV